MKIEKVYWDSDCFLGFFNAEDGKVEKCEGVLQQAERGEVLIITSALTLAEVLWIKGAPRLSKDKAEMVQKFFHRSYIELHNVSRKIAESAQVHVWDNDIRPKDAIHVATAIQQDVIALETFDKNLLKKSGQVGNTPLIIREPLPPAQGRLDLIRPKTDPT